MASADSSLGRPLNIILAAPTGKAAARVSESINGAVEKLSVDEVIKQHKDLVETYLNILSSAKLDSLNGIETADKSVRGMDRNLDNLFPQLTKDTTHTLQLKTLADNDLQASDYAQQTLLITGFVTISIIIIIISFWISHRKYS